MFSLLFILVLISCAVKCDDASNYYVIEMPDDPPIRDSRPFNVYWNVPTKQCTSKKIPFENLYEKYGIIQNENDSFRGEKITILYDPGLFPALLKNESSGRYRFRNGGVPQEGDLEKHLKTFRSEMEQSIPDRNFNGVGIIDFESWRPVFRQNFGVLVPYKDVSYEIERKRHWYWPKAWIQAEAKQRFEDAARTFMHTTLSVAKQMRPNALWGYYGFPYCFNMAANNMEESCATKVPAENDRTSWLWSESSALFPSVYSSVRLTSGQLAALVAGRLREARRVMRAGSTLLPYFWFRYREGGLIGQVDLSTALETLYESKASGFIIWGSSNDVDTVDKCNKLLDYVTDVLGPAVAKYTKSDSKFDNILHDEVATENVDVIKLTEVITTVKPNVINVTESITTDNSPQIAIEPEFIWEPPVNYTQVIAQYVNEEFINSGNDTSIIDESKVILQNLNDSVLINLIFSNLFNNQRDDAKDESKKTIAQSDVDRAYDTTTDNAETSTIIENNLSTKDPFSNIFKTIFVEELTKGQPNFEEITIESDSSYITENDVTTKEYMDKKISFYNKDTLFIPDLSTTESITEMMTKEKFTTDVTRNIETSTINESLDIYDFYTSTYRYDDNNLKITESEDFKNNYEDMESTSQTTVNYDTSSSILNSTNSVNITTPSETSSTQVPIS